MALFQLLASVSRAHGDGYTEVIADRLEYILCYSLEIFDLPVFGVLSIPRRLAVFDFTTSLSDRFLLNCICCYPARVDSF